jgi:hypothetical protein
MNILHVVQNSLFTNAYLSIICLRICTVMWGSATDIEQVMLIRERTFFVVLNKIMLKPLLLHNRNFLQGPKCDWNLLESPPH